MQTDASVSDASSVEVELRDGVQLQDVGQLPSNAKRKAPAALAEADGAHKHKHKDKHKHKKRRKNGRHHHGSAAGSLIQHANSNQAGAVLLTSLSVIQTRRPALGPCSPTGKAAECYKCLG